MEPREKLIKFCEKVSDGHYKITPECAEYQLFEQWITDEQLDLLLSIEGVLKINFLGKIAKNASLPKKKAKAMLHELTEIGVVLQKRLPLGMEVYLQPLYTPGVYEFMLLNEPFCRAHPEVAYSFKKHASVSQEEHAMNTPMGAGIMRVIPVESAIEHDSEVIDTERVSYYIEKNDGHL